ncbi:MAG: hypothetical protein MUC35_07180 [Candidatus Margulisbacteria bacterium]|jgi:adenine deaminase|nr:hypothetical protein [Candidatus Margulisiibacteriota bacterium]
MKPEKCQIKHFEVDDLLLKKAGKYAKVIELAADSLFTRHTVAKYTGVDLERDILKAVAVEAVRATGAIGIGFVKGFGLNRGAIASSFTQNGECIVAVGKSDEDIASAIRRVAALGRGAVLVTGGMLMAELTAADQTQAFFKAAQQLGSGLADPLATLCLLTNTALPELRLTSAGLFDLAKGATVPLFE